MKILLRLLFLFTVVSATAQPALRSQDYERAESFLLYNTAPLVDRSSVRPNWLPGDVFWYRILTAAGSEFIIADPVRRTREPAFNHQDLAAALSKALNRKIAPSMLPFMTLSFSDDRSVIYFAAAGKNWKYDSATRMLSSVPVSQQNRTAVARNRNRLPEVLSPDGSKAAFIRNWNLWIRETSTNKEIALTTDGVKDFGYATDNAGWRKSEKPILLWSPDSKMIATYRQDQRNVTDMYLVSTNVGKPTLQSWKYPLAGADEVISIQRLVIDVAEAKIIPLKIQPDPRRGTLCDDISCGGTGFDDVQWSANSDQLAFVSTSRDHKQEKFRIADPRTGVIREVFEETVATQYESGQGSINWRYLPGTNEIIWYSERDDWGHLYLYDAASGKEKLQITKGDWVVTQLLKVDEKSRKLYFLAQGREKGANPYHSRLYSVGLDGKNLKLLTPEDGNHSITLSPGEEFVIDTYSSHQTPPVTVMRNLQGKLLLTLERADISRLTAAGWKAPVPVTLKARDEKTDLYGLMYTPSNLDPSRKYPVVNYIYPGPQRGSISSWSWSPAMGDHQALAELGFIVVLIEGTCNPGRSKSFHDMCYGNLADNTLPDQISGIRQLAARYPYLDLNRVGIWGHSGGGFAAASALFRYPDFYKVGIAESGNHDSRNYEDDWGERYIGLLRETAEGKTNYDEQANQIFAGKLSGKLMLAHGMMDDNVPPYNTLLVADALIKANKDFDLVIFPHSRHSFGEFGPYMMRRRWDYFVKYLMQAEPPREYQFRARADKRNAVE
jgi:dipeptidyl-peptidase 4